MTKTKLPADFDKVVKNIIGLVAENNTFGIYDRDDIAQEIWILCLDAIKRYDNTRSLYTFLLTHVKNRLKTLKRDKFFRYECPCKLCSFKEDGETGHKNKKHCDKYLKWYSTNLRKSNLAAPVSSDFKGESFYDKRKSVEEEFMQNELLERIECSLPHELKITYLKLKAGEKVLNVEKQKLLMFLKGQFNNE